MPQVKASDGQTYNFPDEADAKSISFFLKSKNLTPMGINYSTGSQVMRPSLDRPAAEADKARAAGEEALATARKGMMEAMPYIGAAGLVAATGGGAAILPALGGATLPSGLAGAATAVGAVGAAGLGGAGGEAYRQLMGIPFGEGEKSSKEAAKKIATAADSQAIGEMAGQVVGAGIRGLINVPWRKLVEMAGKPENQALIKAAENLGIADKLTVAEATGFKPFQAIQDVSARSLAGKGQATARAKDLHDRVINVINDTADQIGPATSPDASGVAIKNSLEALNGSIKAEGARLYTPVDEAMFGKPVKMDDLASLVKSHFSQSDEAAKLAPSVSGRSSKMLAMGEDFGGFKAATELDNALEGFPPDVADAIRQSLKGGAKKATVDVASAAPKVSAPAKAVVEEISQAEIKAAAKEWGIHPTAAEKELKRMRAAGESTGLPKVLTPEEAKAAAVESAVNRANEEAALRAAEQGMTLEAYNKLRGRKEMTAERYIELFPNMAPSKSAAVAAKVEPKMAPQPAPAVAKPAKATPAPSAEMINWEDAKIIRSDLKRMVRDGNVPRDAQILAQRMIPVLNKSMGEAAEAAGHGAIYEKADKQYRSLKELANNTVIPALQAKDPSTVANGIKTVTDVRAVKRALVEVNKDPKAFEVFQRQRVQSYLGDPDAEGELALHKLADNLKKAGKERLAEEFSTPAGKIMLQNMRDVATAVERVAALKAKASGGDVMLGKFKEAADVNSLAQTGLRSFADMVKPSTTSDKVVALVSRGAREAGGLLAAPLMNRVISSPEATRKLIAGIDLLPHDKFAGLAQIARAGVIAAKGIKAGSELTKASHSFEKARQAQPLDLRLGPMLQPSHGAPQRNPVQDAFARAKT